MTFNGEVVNEISSAADSTVRTAIASLTCGLTTEKRPAFAAFMKGEESVDVRVGDFELSDCEYLTAFLNRTLRSFLVDSATLQIDMTERIALTRCETPKPMWIRRGCGTRDVADVFHEMKITDRSDEVLVSKSSMRAFLRGSSVEFPFGCGDFCVERRRDVIEVGVRSSGELILFGSLATAAQIRDALGLPILKLYDPIVGIILPDDCRIGLFLRFRDVLNPDSFDVCRYRITADDRVSSTALRPLRGCVSRNGDVTCRFEWQVGEEILWADVLAVVASLETSLVAVECLTLRPPLSSSLPPDALDGLLSSADAVERCDAEVRVVMSGEERGKRIPVARTTSLWMVHLMAQHMLNISCRLDRPCRVVTTHEERGLEIGQTVGDVLRESNDRLLSFHYDEMQ